RQGNATFEVRDVPTGGGRRATTTVRSDSASDRTTCDAIRSVSIRLKSPVGPKSEEILARATGSSWPADRKSRQHRLRGGSSNLTIARGTPSGRGIGAPTGMPQAPLLTWVAVVASERIQAELVWKTPVESTCYRFSDDVKLTIVYALQ